jgi:hypothetical protein
MRAIPRSLRALFLCLLFAVCASISHAQSVGISTTVEGTVIDPSGAVVANAVVEIQNPVSGFHRSVTTDESGNFNFSNVPFNPYHMTVVATGFAPYVKDIQVRSTVPVSVKVSLKIASATSTVTVQADAGDLIENTPTAHTDIGRTLIEKLPLESASSSLSSLVTLATPGVVADSNGLFHAMGEHADNQFSIDGQPITDQQSKVFSNQLPVHAVQSMEVIDGIPPANYGDKIGLIINIATRSGLQQPLHGAVSGNYGSFGSSGMNFNLGAGTQHWGNFITVGGLNTGRFLDPPEFQVMHAKGNAENAFDHVDFQPRQSDTLHLDAGFTRSWFQTPNSYDSQALNQDQRSQIRTMDFAPGWTHLFNNSTLLTVNGWFRKDWVNYYPSGVFPNPAAFRDQPVTVGQYRTLANTGIHADLSYVKGINNIKVGAQFEHTFLNESFQLGVTSPTYNAVCVDAQGNPDPNPAPTNPNQCATSGYFPNPNFNVGLLPYDLTRNGNLLNFNGHTDIKEEAVYFIDDVTLGNWALNLGVRGDNYNGISHGAWLEPRTGVSYNIKKTGTVLRLGYGKIFETPFNENLILSSSTGVGGLTGALGVTPVQPGRGNQFDAGFQQAFGRFAVVNAEYFWKYTRNAYDFDVLLNTPITFPIMWNKSKIDGFGIRVSMPLYHGLTAYSVMGHSRARFFGPETGGLIFNSPLSVGAFRIDHDEAFEQTTHLQYQPKRGLPWLGFNWRYDSGLVAGSVPNFAAALALDADQQSAIGLYCGNLHATLTTPLTPAACAGQTPFGATLINIPAPGTFNPDLNPPRVAPRNLFDLAVGDDNLFHGEKYKWNVRFTVVNLTDKVALYNFLSTFSGTHFVTPRSYQAQLGVSF